MRELRFEEGYASRRSVKPVTDLGIGEDPSPPGGVHLTEERRIDVR
jgi:hypothetical protein